MDITGKSGLLESIPRYKTILQTGVPVKKWIYHEDQATGIPDVFPIFKKDTIEDLIDRYCKIYKKESSAYLAVISEKLKDTSITSHMKIAMSIPPILYYILRGHNENFWKDPKCVERFKIRCSKLVAKKQK